MSAPEYVMTPAGDLSQPHWQSLLRLPEGHKIVCIALLMRDMAVVCNVGGSICHPSEKPLTPKELSVVLNVDKAWLIQVLREILAPMGLVSPDGDEGWASTDPVVLRHLKRLNRKTLAETAVPPPVLELEADPESETQQARSQRLGRNRKKKCDFRKKYGEEPVVTYVTRDITSCVTTALPEQVTGEVTSCPQPPVITTENQALPNSIKYDGIGMTATAGKLHGAAAKSLVFSSTSNATLPAGVEAAINTLKPEMRPEIFAICQKEADKPEDVLTSNVFLLKERLSKGNKIDNPGGWLRRSIRMDFASSQRESKLVKERKVQDKLKKDQEKAEKQEQERLAHIERHERLLGEISLLDEGIRKEIYERAELQAKDISRDPAQPLIDLFAVDIYIERIHPDCTAQAINNTFSGCSAT